MIFSSRNEDGELASDLVLAGRKTVTRRVRPQPVGAIRAVQPGRAKKGVGFIKILSCVDDEVWKDNLNSTNLPSDCFKKTKILEDEAHREGFKTWEGLWTWIYAHVKQWPLPVLYRIEFELIEDGCIKKEVV